MQAVSKEGEMRMGSFRDKSQEGAAMMLALILIAVVSFLGFALWQYSVTDTLHVARQEKMMKAYYVARAGAEATVKAWFESPGDSKPTGLSKPVYLDGQTGDFVNTLPTKNAGQFIVNVTQGTNGSVIIESTGTVEDVQQKVKVELKRLTGYELGWYDKNGKIILKDFPYQKGTVTLKDPSGNGNDRLFEAGNGDSAKWDADILYFESAVGNPLNRTLKLYSEIIVFTKDIRMHENNGHIKLFLSEGKGFVRPDKPGRWGMVFFQDVFPSHSNSVSPLADISKKAFYFPAQANGIDIGNIQDRSKLELITNPQIPSVDQLYQVVWK